MSGLSRTPGKRVWANPHRGFESRPLRQTQPQVIFSLGVFWFWGSHFVLGPAKTSRGRRGCAEAACAKGCQAEALDHVRLHMHTGLENHFH